MCSLCITSITNINARLSAGKGTRQVFVQRVHVCKRGMCRCIYVCLCICACCVSVSDVCAPVCLVRTARKGSYEGRGGSLGQTGGSRDIRDTAKERCVLGTINTERLLSWVCLGILGAGANIPHSRETECAFIGGPFQARGLDSLLIRPNFIVTRFRYG